MASLSIIDDVVPTPTTSDLLQVLLNQLFFYNIVPYLAVDDLLHLGAASRSIRSLIHDTPGAWRHLDLTRVKAAQSQDDKTDPEEQRWHNLQLREYVTEDE